MDLPVTWNAEFIDSQYKSWKSDPQSVTREWRLFFSGFELARAPGPEAAPEPAREAAPAAEAAVDVNHVLRQSRVEDLIYRYRDLGHLLACVDPLTACPTDHPFLNLSAFRLTEEDLDRAFFTRNFSKTGEATLREIVRTLRETYCRSIGVEYMHLQDPGERHWLQARMEPVRNRPNLDNDEKIRILNKLCQATFFEQYLHSRYVGQKRFSLEGAESIIPMLDMLTAHAAGKGCREITLGMAHRGRLNVEVNILEKLYEAVFCEFEDNYDPDSLVGTGDVKYHKGYASEKQIPGAGKVRIVLAHNPSHLESVCPVVEGMARARQEQLGDARRQMVLPILLHGDAAFAGQGVVAETLNLSQLEGYRTGGTIHVVINNQIGFTTLPSDARSTRYSTDIAKMLMAPIFHVHGENPEALVHVVKLAYDYRAEFGKDVVIDVICYRRFGHNEADEPYYTQPRMYDRIKERPPVYRLYMDKLREEGVVAEEDLERIREGITECMEKAYVAARERPCTDLGLQFYDGWESVGGPFTHDPVETGVPEDILLSLARKLSTFPEGFSVHPRLLRILQRRAETVENGSGVDWATAEMLAFATLLEDRDPVRLSGQDSRRGTFSHRHAVLVDTRTGDNHTPLNALSDRQALFSVYDSSLSEYAVLGFEYGYSLAVPYGLTIWEAQFGDFANNAQVVIDEYIAAAEAKWVRRSGLVMLLPHGYEGQGPDHSSARLERYLQLCAEDNMQVCCPTTPAQYFHLLRRQVKSSYRKPLIIMTPKSLLRHPLAVSTRADLASEHFKEILPDTGISGTPRRVLLCAGKIYYDLLETRNEAKASDVAIVRIEQFYPYPEEQLAKAVAGFENVREWFWVQEEPENMGAWHFMRSRLQSLVEMPVSFMGRTASASPATGFSKIHKQEQAAITHMAIHGL